ncbi:hypothetical protein ACFWN1_26590 [Streptomyces sp. NPDC058459]|uniref:hypothetical protein n=1 Tax=Streptomyces sp. NPDC058459 TaxID=3346508 RepID=UPI003667F52F
MSYAVDEFGVDYPGGTFLSGDRFLACPRCRELVDAGDWKGLRDWIGPNGLDTSSRAMLFGFKAHRRGGAVELAAQAGPEEQLS